MGVTHLVYEAYAEHALPRMEAIAAEARRLWPTVGRMALLHRTGRVELAEPSVVVAVCAPHRPEAFAAARWSIDTLKATVPIWKLEVWDGGSAWSEASCPAGEVQDHSVIEVRR
jgi:molybdopterin synthase catalytic subunit